MGHPAKFSDPIIEKIESILGTYLNEMDEVLDPMAGTGKIAAALRDYIWSCIDIEDWDDKVFPVELGDATDMPYFTNGMFNAVVTSPTYGNRMADHHEAKDGSRRITYTHNLGRPLQPNNTGDARFPSPKYNTLHQAAWREVYRVLKPGGLFVLNVKDFIRGGERIKVTSWHRAVCVGIGFKLLEFHGVPCPGMKFGENHEARVDEEMVFVFMKPFVEPKRVDL
jgi:SAM-dependent methyltransferase